MTRTTRPRHSRRGKRTRSAQPSYEAQWLVKDDSKVPAFQVKVPKITENAEAEAVPEFVRFDMRRKGLRGKLAPRPVLHRSEEGAGGFGGELLVPTALKKLVKEGENVTVTGVSKRAFRWYRFFRSGGTALGTIATIIGALLATLGPVWIKSGLGQGLLIAGIVLTLAGVFALLVSYWRAPAGGDAAS